MTLCSKLTCGGAVLEKLVHTTINCSDADLAWLASVEAQPTRNDSITRRDIPHNPPLPKHTRCPMPRKEPVPAAPISAQAQQDLVSEGIENFELPRSVVAKIAKSAVRTSPPTALLR